MRLKDAIKHEKDSNNLIYDLNNSQSILNNLIYKNKNIIKHLEYKKQNIQNSINSYTINIQETAEIKHHSNTHHDDINDIKYTNQGYPNSDQNNSLETRSILNYIKYAGAVAFGFVAVYIIGKFRKKDETNKIYIDKSENIYYTKKSKYQRRDEFIEINMNKD